MTDDDDTARMIFKSTMRFSIDFNTWARHPITRREALYEAFRAPTLRLAWRWIKVAWRGYWLGTVYNAGA